MPESTPFNRRASDQIAPPNQHDPESSLGSAGSVIDRRVADRRRLAALGASDANAQSAPTPSASAKPGATGLERRRGPGRRLSDFVKAAEEGELTQEQFLFVMAIQAFKHSNNVQFPSWTDVLEVMRLLGYRKTCRSELNLRNCEDWQEPSDNPASVRPRRWQERFRLHPQDDHREAA